MTEIMSNTCENVTSAYMLVIASFSIAFIFILLASNRHERYLWIYAIAFALNAVCFSLCPLQEILSPWLSIILADTLAIFAYELFLLGILSFDKREKVWPVRLWVYPVIAFICLVILTFVFASYRWRIVVFSLCMILLSGEFIFAFRTGFKDISKKIKKIAITSLSLYIFVNALRAGVIFVREETTHLMLSGDFLTTIAFFLTLFFLILWAGILFFIDIAKLLATFQDRNSTLETIALKDDLTGLYNRYHLDHVSTTEMERQDRYQTPLSMILFDLDHFKNINDRFGHDNGDIVLVEIGNRTMDSIRETDILFRWGGEEFIILAPQTGIQGAGELAEKLRRVVAAKPIIPVGAVTASFGVAERLPDESREEWFHRVDQALYRAKNAGRNRVEVCSNDRSKQVTAIKIYWQNGWNSGNSIIDREHRELVSMGNELLNMAFSGTSAEEKKARLELLIERLNIHFRDEEEILQKIEYPDLEDHHLKHEALLSELDALYENFKKFLIDPAVLFHLIVDKIIMEHMLMFDKTYYPYLPKKE